MTPPVIDRSPVTPPDPWSTNPIAAGRHRRLMWGAVVLVAVAAVVFMLTRTAPSTTPTAPSNPEPPPAEQIPPSIPFDVAIEVTDAASMDNDGLFGEKAAVPNGAVDDAASQIGGVLDRYLDAQFITTETRFSDRPLSELLNERALDALSDDDLAGLGVLGIAVQQVEAEPVTVTARALTSGSDVAVMVVRYDARAQVTTEDGESAQLHQQATMVFVPEDGEWRAEAIDAELDLPLAEREVAS
jgi:hypothetical protein